MGNTASSDFHGKLWPNIAVRFHDTAGTVESCREWMVEELPRLLAEEGIVDLPFPSEFIKTLSQADVDEVKDLRTDWDLIPPSLRPTWLWVAHEYVEINVRFPQLFDNDVVAESIRAELRSLQKKGVSQAALLLLVGGAWLNPRNRDDQMRHLQILEKRMDGTTKWATGILESLGQLEQPEPVFLLSDDPTAWMRTVIAWRLKEMIPALAKIREIVESVLSEATQGYEDKKQGIVERTPRRQGNETAFSHRTYARVVRLITEAQGNSYGAYGDTSRLFSLWGLEISPEAHAQWRRRLPDTDPLRNEQME